jgi:hypothetical protein
MKEMNIKNIISSGRVNPLRLKKHVKEFIERFEDDMKDNIAAENHCPHCEVCKEHRDNIIEIVKNHFRKLL